MAADAEGNDITLVGVPLTGFLAFAPDDATIPTPEQGKATPLVLDPDFRKVGLLKQDGGFEWTEEPDGDALEFWQEGYSVPSGLANVRLKFTVAEESAITRQLRTGKTPDTHGYLTVDGGGNLARYVFFSEEIYKNGVIRRRVAYGRVVSAKIQKSERGTAQGIEFEVEIYRHAAFNLDHYGEWIIVAIEPDPEP